jgi:hypothetical protein
MTDKKRTTLVKLVMTVEVDIDELEAEYGRTFTTREAQDDVRWSMLNTAMEGAYGEEISHRVLKLVSHNAAR